MRHEQDGSPVVAERQHLADRAILEADVADRQHLVDQQHVRVDVGGDGEAEPRVHARRVALQRAYRYTRPRSAKSTMASKRWAHLAARQPQNDAVELDVLAAGQLGVKPGAEIDQRSDPTRRAHLSAGRSGDARQQLQQGGLARAVVADQPDRFARLQAQADVAQRPQLAARPVASSQTR